MLPVIPYPAETDMNGIRAVLPATVTNIVFSDAVETLISYAARTHGIRLTPDPEGAIRFLPDASLPAEGYTVTVTDINVTVRAADGEGAQHAAATLVQLMESAEKGLTLPVGKMIDAPACSWRGVMVDLARDWHELHVLYEYVDMCRFFKIRYLHLHFTDDQSYTLPSRAYPLLSTPGRSYTEDQIKELIAYAKKRGVQLIPEIDVPGHCTSFANAYGNIFGTDGIIRQTQASMEAMETLFGELCDLFASSDYIHIGGDEAAIDQWVRDEATVEAFRAAGVDVDGTEPHALVQIMYATFIRRMCETVTAHGKTPVVWEGFDKSVNHLIPRNTVVMSWENFYQVTPSLQEAGFRLVNCSWSPMYIVTPAAYWTPREIYNWDIYTWRPVHPGSPYVQTGLVIEPTEQIEGGQLLAWGDHVERSFPTVAEGVREEQRLVEERTPALAENTWHRSKISDWIEFSARMTAVASLYERFRKAK